MSNSAVQYKPENIRAMVAIALLFAGALFAAASFFIPVSQLIGLAVLLGLAVLTTANLKAGIITAMVYVAFEAVALKIFPEIFIPYARLLPEVIIGTAFVTGGLKRVFAARSAKISSSFVNPIGFFLFLFVSIAVVSIVYNSVAIPSAALGLRQLLRFLVLYQALVWHQVGKNQIKLFAGVFAGLVVFESVLGLLQALIGAPLDNLLYGVGEQISGSVPVVYEIWQQRVPGTKIFATMGRYDQLGTFLSVGSAVALGWLYGRDKLHKRNAILILLVSLPALLLTYSRISWFSFILALIVVSVFLKKDKKVLAGLMVAVVLIAGYVTVKEIEVRKLIDEPRFSPMERLLEAFSYNRLKSEYTGKGRLYFIVEAPQAVIRNSPIFGVGPGMFGGGAAALLHNTDAYDRLNLAYGLYGTEGQIDNNWVSILAETGILGLVFYLGIFISLIRFFYRAQKDSALTDFARSAALGMIGATSAFMLMGLSGTYFEVRTVAFYYWLLAALTVCYISLERQNENTAHQ